MNHPRLVAMALVVAVPAAFAGCGSSGDSGASSTTDSTTRAASGTACEVLAGAVSQSVTFRNTLSGPVTLSSPQGSVCDDGSSPAGFSGTGNASQLDGLVLPEGGSATVITFDGPPSARIPFDVAYAAPGGVGRTAANPWSIRINFGAENASGSVSGWNDRYDNFRTEGPCVETFGSADAGYYGMVGVVNTPASTITFAPRDAAKCG